jgi:cell wall-associated NlpC family hydrolase
MKYFHSDKKAYIVIILIVLIFSFNRFVIFNKGESKMADANINKRMEEFSVKGPLTPGMKEEMLHYEFWTSRLSEGSRLIMDMGAIEKFNKETIKKADTVYRLQEYKESLSKTELTDYLKEYKFTDKMKVDDKGIALGKDFLDSLMKNTNLEVIKYENKISYGMSVKKLQVRSFPTETGAYESSESSLDRFQETTCEPCEAVLILHESKDKKWYFIQMYNYRGWVKSEGIALANDKKILFDYANSEDFIVVSGNHVDIENHLDSSVNKTFNMGTKLILASEGEKNNTGMEYYVVKLPIKSKKGYLEFTDALIAKSKDVVKGYLPYTRENIIKQAFKMQGEKYDWGNKFEGRDCSSFIADIYKTFGIILPRNAGDQENGYGKQYKFAQGDLIERRNKILDNVKPGAAIFLSGHVTMYLGKVDGVHYMIHDFLAYGRKDGDKYISVPVSAVAVTSTLLPVTSGAAYIQKFNTAVQFEN